MRTYRGVLHCFVGADPAACEPTRDLVQITTCAIAWTGEPPPGPMTLMRLEALTGMYYSLIVGVIGPPQLVPMDQGLRIMSIVSVFRGYVPGADIINRLEKGKIRLELDTIKEACRLHEFSLQGVLTPVIESSGELRKVERVIQSYNISPDDVLHRRS